MLLWRASIPDEWLPKVLANLNELLVDHCHLERKAAASALNLIKYPELSGYVKELNHIAQEELGHFHLILNLLESRGFPFGPTPSSPWIGGMMRLIRKGRREQVIDHLIAASLIEGRSCEKFQILGDALKECEPQVARIYADLVESEGNHYSHYWTMACEIDEGEAHRRIDDFLEMDAKLICRSHDFVILH
ncbi:MAG: tRNA isopentenyl-2-thiomethyl-A-37 hydroxylase MiaE [Verrucomicrobiota bacterium]|nr:tRNA isopentenyl-2-thiomethyl-A-37 hydroxylase MiaE [Verrucomicrobiota bacterium]